MIRSIFRLTLAAALLSPSLAAALESPALRQLIGASGDATPPILPAPREGTPTSIDWREAGTYVGQNVLVSGKITHAYANEKVCFLNFGDYKTTVTLVIFGSAFKDFPAGPQFYYEGKDVQVTGQVQKSPWGTLQIVLGSPEQIVVTSPDANAVLDWEDVNASMENQVVTVEGVVQAVTKSERVAYLNFHQNWSRYVAGTIFAKVYSHFPEDLQGAYQGKKVQITGRVKLYEGRPELLLFSAAQVKIVGGPAPKTHRIKLAKDKVVFDDGDTVRYAFTAEESPDGKPYEGGLRLLGFDTPETMHPEDGIFYSQPKGQDAAALAHAALRSAKKIEFVTHGDRDKYARMLGHLVVDGELLGALQLRAGLAFEMISNYGDNGFPDEAAQMMDAWNKGPIAESINAGKKPPFERPGDWRRINQVHELAVAHDAWEAMTPAQKKEHLAKVRKVVQERRSAAGGPAPAE
ncbi:MAG: thermonuclease family protein [Elusimicrobia bacterium]|nr:thermonuclease family protein [Elusimicrobiota bacterium]